MAPFGVVELNWGSRDGPQAFEANPILQHFEA
jgi:hypothetical protein